MSFSLHLVGGLLLTGIALWCFVRAAKTKPLFRVPEFLEKLAMWGNSPQQWSWGIRGSNIMIGAILLVVAVSLWVST